MPRKNRPEKRQPSQKKMRKMRRRGMEKGKKKNMNIPYPPGDDEYGF